MELSIHFKISNKKGFPLISLWSSLISSWNSYITKPVNLLSTCNPRKSNWNPGSKQICETSQETHKSFSILLRIEPLDSDHSKVSWLKWTSSKTQNSKHIGSELMANWSLDYPRSIVQPIINTNLVIRWWTTHKLVLVSLHLILHRTERKHWTALIS